MTYNLVQKLLKTTGSVADMLANCKIILTLSIGCVMKWLIHNGKRKKFLDKILGTALNIPKDSLENVGWWHLNIKC